jgi:glucan phosphoethanolaminetransferase (alkaline phosphatase superfamily)
MSTFFTNRLATIEQWFSGQKLPGADTPRLFSWSFWIESNISPTSEYLAAALGLVVATIILLVAWRFALIRAHRRVPVYSSPIALLTNLIVFIIIITAAYTFFRSQELAYVSSRFIVLSTIVLSGAWLGWIAWQIKRTVPSARASYLEKERFFRYLPKKQGKSS